MSTINISTSLMHHHWPIDIHNASIDDRLLFITSHACETAIFNWSEELRSVVFSDNVE